MNTRPLLPNAEIRAMADDFLASGRADYQRTYDPLDILDDASYGIRGMDAAHKKALALRDEAAKLIRKCYPEITVRGSSLTNQLRKYKSFGIPDGRVRTVYYMTLRRNG